MAADPISESMFEWIIGAIGGSVVGLAIFVARLWWWGGTANQMLKDHIQEDRTNNTAMDRKFSELSMNLASLTATQDRMHRENREDRERMHNENREDRERSRQEAHQERISIQNTVTTQNSQLGGRIDGLVAVLLKKNEAA